MKIEGSTTWITGASSGIGEGLALVLSRMGARLVLSSRKRDRLEAVRTRCAQPDRHLCVPLDLERPPSIQEAVRHVADAVGPVDILINNGGVSQRSLAVDTSLEVDRRLMEINYFGTITLTKALLPSMLERKSGHIVVVTSLMGKMAAPVRSAYAASKHALHGFFDALRAEIHDQGIRITLVAPGFIRTQISVNALTGDGSPADTMDDAVKAGMDPEVCAHKIARAIERERDEVIIAGREKVGVYIKAFSPALYNRIIRKVRVT